MGTQSTWEDFVILRPRRIKMKYLVVFVVVLCCLCAVDVGAQKGDNKAKKKEKRAVNGLIKFCKKVTRENNTLVNTDSTFDDVWDDVVEACENITQELMDSKNQSAPTVMLKESKTGEQQLKKTCRNLEKAKLFDAADAVAMKKKKPNVVMVLAESIALFEDPCDDLAELMNPQ